MDWIVLQYTKMAPRLQFTPGRKSANQLVNLYKYQVYEKQACQCIQEQTKDTNNGWVIPNLSRAEKITLDILYYPGGRIQFGNRPINFFGRVEGQLGGSIAPLRN